MSQNTYKESVVKLAKQIKKEHFWRIGLWTAGISLTLIWLAFLIATSISTGELKIWNTTQESIKFDSIEALAYFTTSNPIKFISITGNEVSGFTLTYNSLNKIVDLNPLCLTYTSALTGWYLLVVLAPIGYMGCIYIIAVVKNMITPQAIKRVVRKGIQFNYLKQKDADYICDEIDYNIGIKERVQEEHLEPRREQVIKETYEKPRQEETQAKKPLFSMR